MSDTITQQLFEEKPEATAEQTPPQATPAAPVTPPVVEEKPEPFTLSGPALAAVLDEREKRKEWEKKYSALEARVSNQPPPSVPADPEQLAAYVNEQTQRALTSERFDLSQTLAEEKHGADAVKSAMDWGMTRAQQSPAFAAEYVKQKHPIDWAVRQYQQDQQLTELRADEAAFARKLAEKHGLLAPPQPNAAPAAQAAAAPPQPVATPPKPATPSLVHAQSAGTISTPVAPDNPVMKRLFG